MSFARTVLTAFLSAAILCCASNTASAVVVSTPGTGVQPLAPSNDAVEFLPNSLTTPLGVFVLQTGVYTIDFTFLPDFTTPYVINESITVDGNTFIVPISLQNVVTSAADTLIILGSGPIYVAGPDIFLTILPVTVGPIGSTGSFQFSLSAELKRVPEPATAGLIALALLSMLWLSAVRRQA